MNSIQKKQPKELLQKKIPLLLKKNPKFNTEFDFNICEVKLR